MGLVADVVEAGTIEEHFATWVARNVLPRSGAGLAFAVRAARATLREAVGPHLEQLERLYLDELMATTDAVEGIQAFVDKRKPIWTHR